MNLVPFQFGVFTGGRQADDAARRIDFFGDLEGFLIGMPEQFLHHADHVIVGVLVVVPKDDVVARLLPRFLVLLLPQFHACVFDRFRNGGAALLIGGAFGPPDTVQVGPLAVLGYRWLFGSGLTLGIASYMGYVVILSSCTNMCWVHTIRGERMLDSNGRFGSYYVRLSFDIGVAFFFARSPTLAMAILGAMFCPLPRHSRSTREIACSGPQQTKGASGKLGPLHLKPPSEFGLDRRDHASTSRLDRCFSSRADPVQV